MSEKSAVIINDDATFGITRSAIVSLESTSIPRPAFSVDKETAGKKLNPWGENNDFPQQVIGDVRKNPQLGTLLNQLANLLYSSGLEWGIPKRVNGIEILEPVDDTMDAEIRLFCRKSNINRYLSEAAKDLYWFYNVFVEIILSLDKTKVAQICTQAAEECRFAVQNSKGVVENVFVNAQWESGAKEDDALTKKIPVIDPYYDPAGKLRLDNRGFNYIYPLNYANPGNKFYQLADWNAIRESGWLAVSELVPKHKKALLANQATIKYHIQISSRYWDTKFAEWDKKTGKEKSDIKRNELDSIQSLIVGAEKAGTNF